MDDQGDGDESGLDAVLNERDAAWARLVKATETLHLRAMRAAVAFAFDPTSEDAKRDLAPEREAVSAAEQALIDLGVPSDLLPYSTPRKRL